MVGRRSICHRAAFLGIFFLFKFVVHNFSPPSEQTNMSGWESYYKTEGEEEEEEEESPDQGGKWLHHVVCSVWKKDFPCLLFFAGSTLLSDISSFSPQII